MRALTISLLLALLAGLAQAQSEEAPAAPAEDPAAPPPLPPKVTDGDVIPSVVIRTEEDKRIEEYSLNGRVYMVKVTPAVGPPYYYMDDDGDGLLELQPGDEALNPVRPAYWKVKEWK
ncbi:MAG: DUF2782 domain-containing protein [Xanthomonadales bacterium]|nr:DUF2782 domain-containing protein [Xanthomonadales bacterium]